MSSSGSGTELRARLRRTWYALFAHHRGLLPVQAQAIPHLLAGRECLLCAPTAGGKTEALVAAALEHARGGAEHGPEVVYVCPTRALVNDVHRRLSPIAHRLHLKVGRHTADHRPDQDKLPDVLITTPEGLDSRLCRHPGTLRSVRWLLLDELHLLAGSLRGDQLAALTWRLRVLVRAAGGELRAAAASATIGDPAAVAGRYLIDGVVVNVPADARALTVTAKAAPTVGEAVEALCADAHRGKTLVFANSRNEVETLAASLRGRAPYGDAVYAHHGSLLKAERERVEAAFLSRRNAICVATQTLELGIDIGDVDRVALYGPPSDVSSLLQRIGRAGRRTGHADVLALAETPSRALRFAFLLDRAAVGDLCADLAAYHPASVIQQACSLLMQNRGRTLQVEALLERVPPWQSGYWSASRLSAALAAREDLFRKRGDVFLAGDALDAAFTRGTMHSQIAGESAGVVVYDALTQRPIGRVASVEKGDLLTLGGQATRVVGRRGADVWVEGSALGQKAKFRLRPGPVMGASDARKYLNYLGVPAGLGALLPGFWVHGLGEARGRVVAWVLRKLGHGVAPGGPLAFDVQGFPDEISVPPDDLPLDLVEAALHRQQTSLAKLTGQGPDFRHLPPEERERAIRLALPPETVRHAWRGLRWTTVAPEVALRLRAVLDADVARSDAAD